MPNYQRILPKCSPNCVKAEGGIQVSPPRALTQYRIQFLLFSRRSLGHHWAAFWHPLGSLWLSLGSIWLAFGILLDPVVSLGVPLGTIWFPFGTMLGPFRSLSAL